jgi:EAL and modified HD-GYP domain-containing signal transduction protein
MCELLGNEFSGQMFTVGLLSLLDALMDRPLVDLLDDLTLSTNVKMALLDYLGDNGEVLLNVIRYEQGKWDELILDGQDMKDYFSCYMDAVKWADSTIESLQ